MIGQIRFYKVYLLEKFFFDFLELLSISRKNWKAMVQTSSIYYGIIKIWLRITQNLQTRWLMIKIILLFVVWTFWNAYLFVLGSAKFSLLHIILKQLFCRALLLTLHYISLCDFWPTCKRNITFLLREKGSLLFNFLHMVLAHEWYFISWNTLVTWTFDECLEHSLHVLEQKYIAASNVLIQFINENPNHVAEDRLVFYDSFLTFFWFSAVLISSGAKIVFGFKYISTISPDISS